MRFFPFLIALSFFLYKKNLHQKYVFLFIILIFLIKVPIFLSGERTSFYLFNFSILLFLLFLNDFKRTRIMFFYFIYYL